MPDEKSPMDPQLLVDRLAEARQMRDAMKARNLTLEIIRTRNKCTGEQVFQIIHGKVVEGELRDRLFAFICPPPPVAKPPSPPEPEPHRDVPVPPLVVLDLITKPSERGTVPRPAVGEAYGTPPAEPPKVAPTPPPAPVAAPAEEKPAVGPETLPVGPPPVYPVPPPGEKSDPEVGARLREVMRAQGWTVRELATYFGHSTPSNIQACLSRSGSRKFQLRMCQAFGLSARAEPVPGWTEHQKMPKPGDRVNNATQPAIKMGEELAAKIRETLITETNRQGGIIRDHLKLPKVPRATDTVSPTLLTDQQTAAALRLALAADDLNRKTRERNAAAREYKDAIEQAATVGIRFATPA